MKLYIKPETELVAAIYGEGLMKETISLPKDETPSTGGGDAKKGFFDEEKDDNMWSKPPSLWDD